MVKKCFLLFVAAALVTVQTPLFAELSSKAKKAAILSMMHGFPSSQGQITEATLGAYLSAVESASPDAVTRSCGQFLAGKVADHNNSFMPTAAELSANARAWDEAIAKVTADREMAKLGKLVSYPIGTLPAPPLEPLGPTKLEIGGVMTDISHLSHDEKEEVLKTGKLPPSEPNRINAPTPRLQRMTK